MQFLVEVELDELGHVLAEAVGSHVRSGERLFHDQFRGVDLEFLALGDHADHHGGAAVADHLVGLLRGLFESHRFEGVVGASVGEALNGRHGIFGRGVDGVSGPEGERLFEFGRARIDGDDLARASDGRAVYRGQANSATPNDDDGRPDFDLSGVDHRPETGHHRAANEGAAVEGHVVSHFHTGPFVDEHLLGVRPEVEELGERFAPDREPRRVSRGPPRLVAFTEHGASCGAVATDSAESGHTGDDMVAWREVGHSDPYGLDDARRFVAGHAGQFGGVVAVDKVQIGVANTDRTRADQDLTGFGIVDVDLFDG